MSRPSPILTGFDYTKGTELALPARDWRARERAALSQGGRKARDPDGTRAAYAKGGVRLFEYYEGSRATA